MDKVDPTNSQECQGQYIDSIQMPSADGPHVPYSAGLLSLQSSLLQNKEPCSIYERIRCHSKCWNALPETAKSGADSKLYSLADSTSRLIRSSYSSLLQLLPQGSSPSLIDGATRRTLSKNALLTCVRNFRLAPASSDDANKIVAVALPNGSLLGLVSMAVATYYTLAPINVTGGAEQFQADVLSMGAKRVLVLYEDVHRLGLNGAWVRQHGIDVHFVNQCEDMTFTITPSASSTSQAIGAPVLPNGADDTCIMLFTSGTTGSKKIVPITLHSVVSAVAFVGESWGLSDQDVCLNMMPLNHIGGLVRNLFSPILLGSATICCSAFDPNMFWDLVVEEGAT